MKRFAWRPFVAATSVGTLFAAATCAALAVDPPSAGKPQPSDDKQVEKTDAPPPPTRDEAQARARLLHETIHGALLVMHRDYFREDEKMPLPSQALDDVFDELERSQGVELRWMSVDAQAMNLDHEPQDEFEKRAVQAIVAGEQEYGAVEQGRYRHAGRIRLASECLSCHVPSRTSNRERSAAVVIGMPVRE